MATPEFSEEQLASDRANSRMGVNSPTYTSLLEHMKRWGPEGVLESAAHLEEDQFEKLRKQAKKMRYDRTSRKWVSA